MIASRVFGSEGNTLKTIAVNATRQTVGSDDHDYRRPLTILTVLFFLWGFLTSLNDVLVPRLRVVFDLSYAKAMLVQVAFFSAYFVFSIPWAKCVERFGYKRSLVSGLFTMSLGAFLFVPAASLPSFPLFLTALVILGAGVTGLQVSANPYVVLLGDTKTSPSRLTLTQAFNSLGTTLGPKLGGLFILGTVPLVVTRLHAVSSAQLSATRIAEAASVRLPYGLVSVALLLLAIIIALISLPSVQPTESKSEVTAEGPIWKHRNLTLGVIALFCYVGAEVSIGSLLVNYLGESKIAGLSALAASGYVSFYWGGAMVGRFAGAGLLKLTKPSGVLAGSALCAAILVSASILTSGHVAMWTLLAVGLFNSIMFPTIFALAVSGLGSRTGEGSGLLTMAIVGGAVVPLAVGALADHAGVKHALFIPILCYLYVLFYSIRGCKPEEFTSAT